MWLDNRTSFPAVLQTADFGSELRFAVVVWKSTYRLHADGRLSPADDPMPITGDPIETEYGMFHGDLFLRKQGADLCVLGTLRRSHPVTQTLVTIRCGSFSHSLRVTGDRVWVPTRALDVLAASSPRPFTEMSLGFSRSFGGTARYKGLLASYPDNPMGRGYALEVDDARGKPLPNLEAAAGPFVERWQDTPRPAGWGPYPMH